MAAEPAVGTALNSPESQSLSRLHRRGGAEDLRTSPHPDEGEPQTGWGDFSERAGQAFGSKRRDLIGYQRRVEEIANRLRLQFSLRE
jgi:hypothetical protein